MKNQRTYVLDCRSVFEGMGGIGRVAAALARELPRALPEDEVVLLLGARRPREPLSTAPNAREVQVQAAMLDPIFEQVRLPGVLDELDADLFHGTCFAVPLASDGVLRVSTVHDVVFRSHPDLVEPGLRAYLDRWTDVACDVADAVVTPSAYSRREIARCYGRPEGAIHVVPNAVDAAFFGVVRAPAPSEPVVAEGASPRVALPPLVLYVGALEAKKNVVELVRGFGALVRRAPTLPHHLVLVGGARQSNLDLRPVLAELGEAAGRVQLVGHVSDPRLRELLGRAEAFAYLSEHEGFGLPPLEAMAAGVPAVVADRASLPEVTGGAALLVDPHDPDAVGSSLERLLTDGELRTDLIARGREVARRTSWTEVAHRLALLYRALTGAKSPAEVTS